MNEIGKKRYDKYKKARDCAWDTLIKSGICQLPINLKKIADTYGITILSYKTALINNIISIDEAVGNGFSKIIDQRNYIFVSSSRSDGEIRFTMACELGRYILGQKISGKPLKGKKFNRSDYEAYVFARDLLMPAAIIYGLGLHSAENIERTCVVPYKLAEKRAKRMEELYMRNKFNEHPSERMVTEQFKDYIDNNI